MDPLEVIARLNPAEGSDVEPPTLDELTAARDDLARQLHALRRDGVTDLEALQSLQSAYATAVAAIEEIEASQRTLGQQVDDLLAGVPDPDAPATPPAGVPADPDGGEPTAPARVLSVREAAARLGLTATATSAPEDLARTDYRVMVGDSPRDDLTWHDLAHSFASSARGLKNGRERVARIETKFAQERTLPGNIGDNTRIVDDIVRPEAVAAAGGCCALPTPIYENPVLTSAARPIRDSVTSFGTDRGVVQFFPAICIPDSGADIWTCEDDAAVDPENEATWKVCLEVECEDSQTVDVNGVYRCLEIGNFQRQFSPEQWEGAIRAVTGLQARRAEAQLFTAMREGTASLHTGAAFGSIYTNLLNNVGLAAAQIRQDQRYVGVELHLWLAEWVLAAIATDARNRRYGTADMVENTSEMVATALANEGVNVTYSIDVDTILAGDQLSGPLEDYPAMASAVLAAEGQFTFLDGGTFDLGTEIRDHDLNRQNKVAAFAESFEGLLSRGCGSKSLDIPVEICDTTSGCVAATS